ncbi:hypothetical protein [Aureispira sp. CCB-E]|uniref:hypothetical protein n=1 Tax=Aureispira sp. CCB-E TaxID=3051121 RepID=UPI0028692272|nr:hypothetical protein [Aureispira sp. CCB-E]WMX13250.1 hypothetical protein QP953_20610 [Aureispira sp. CCB-E]
MLKKLIIRTKEMVRNLKTIRQEEQEKELQDSSHLQKGKSILETYQRVKKE